MGMPELVWRRALLGIGTLRSNTILIKRNVNIRTGYVTHGANAPHGDDAHTTSSNKEVMAGTALEHCFLHVTSYLTRFIQKKPRPKRLCQNTLRKVLCSIGASDCRI